MPKLKNSKLLKVDSQPQSAEKDGTNKSAEKDGTNKSDEEKFDSSTEKAESKLKYSDLILFYGYQLEFLQYEANGIWNRFNMMIGINLSLFVLLSFIFTSKINHKDDLVLIVCLGGLALSIWSLLVLKKLWLYHYHWKSMIPKIEALLPVSLAKPFSGIPESISKNQQKRSGVLYKAKTQPFFIIIAFIWLSIIISIISRNEKVLNTNDSQKATSDTLKLESGNTKIVETPQMDSVIIKNIKNGKK